MAVDKVDFRSPAGAAEEVNAWVQEQNSAAVGVMDCNKVRGRDGFSFIELVAY